MAEGDGRDLVTGPLSHQIYVREGKTKRWMPDLWTMQAEGLSPADLQVLTEEELEALEEQEAVNSRVPRPSLPDGCYVESETGVFHLEGEELVRILNPGALVLTNEQRAAVVFLPDSVLRGFRLGARVS